MCGNQNTWLMGVNWWLNDHTRFMFNFNKSTITACADLAREFGLLGWPRVCVSS